ncbi:putative diacylglycerol kinase [Gregarina niphandrodes]|uniref:Diacylglycerol kinase n=1 Tax=Gregarina niphandrodes TaxID=110365 RepID=A0A023BBL0_GRENI|nr:putative diacylglycerol kinase [Gregarina niphandrodes]EZG79585.1 putative diacylglycerol kinase [Gregarina niphandrodes]|eukprot:XP_011134409.1 putative diacylglycerol kinase [Gregarina niphandrodes]
MREVGPIATVPSSKEVAKRGTFLNSPKPSTMKLLRTLVKKKEVSEEVAAQRWAEVVCELFSAVTDMTLLLERTGVFPFVVFVNPKSGGQLGSLILKESYAYLNPWQVIDLSIEKNPVEGLYRFQGLAITGRLRAIACGGDGTVSWVIDSINTRFASIPSYATLAKLYQIARNYLEEVNVEGGCGQPGGGKTGDASQDRNDTQSRNKTSTNQNIVKSLDTHLHQTRHPGPDMSDREQAERPVPDSLLPVQNTSTAMISGQVHGEHSPTGTESAADAPPAETPLRRLKEALKETKWEAVQVPVAVLPLGTGNDLSKVLNWGATFSNHNDYLSFMRKLIFGRPATLDIWDLEVYKSQKKTVRKTAVPTDGTAAERQSSAVGSGLGLTLSSTVGSSTIGSSGLGSSASEVPSGPLDWKLGSLSSRISSRMSGVGTSGPVKSSVEAVEDAMTESSLISRRSFTNYIDIGIAARIALKFHTLREAHPELFRSRLGNKFLYGEVGVRDYLVDQSVNLEGIEIFCDGQLVDLERHLVQGGLEGLAFVNIGSFGGGVEPWKGVRSHHSSKKRKARKTTGPGAAGAGHCGTGPSSAGPSGVGGFSGAGMNRAASGDLVGAASSAMMPPSAGSIGGQSSGGGWESSVEETESVHLLDSTPKCDTTPKEALLHNRFPLIPPSGGQSGGLSGGQSGGGLPGNDGAPGLNRMGSPRTVMLQEETGLRPISEGRYWTTGNGSVAEPPHTRFRPQRMADGRIELIGFRSLLHLGRVQVGMADSVKIAQGKSFVICIKNKVPYQVDGEPSTISHAVCRIKWKCRTTVLTCSSPIETVSQTRRRFDELDEVNELQINLKLEDVRKALEKAAEAGEISDQQYTTLIRRFQYLSYPQLASF